MTHSYNEELNDLLWTKASKTAGAKPGGKKLDIRDGGGDRGFEVKGVTEKVVTRSQEVCTCTVFCSVFFRSVPSPFSSHFVAISVLTVIHSSIHPPCMKNRFTT
jgi:hypothetical protein